jgi:multisubunit Na+/H+ antiporter MnhE subunit
MSRAWSAVLGLLIAAPFYWLLVDTTSSPDLWAGGAAALIAAGAYSAAYFESDENAAIRLRWLRLALQELAKVPLGIAIVCREVFVQALAPRRRRGVIEIEPFDAGQGSAHDLGRRALVEGFRSFAPNTVVIGVDSDNDRLLVHRLGLVR